MRSPAPFAIPAAGGRGCFGLAPLVVGGLAWSMAVAEEIRTVIETPSLLVVREAGEARRFFRVDGSAGGRGWRVAGAGRETIAGGAYLQQREFPYHQVVFVAGGRGWVELGGLRQALAAGAVYAVSPDARTALRSDPSRPLRRYYLWLEGAGGAALLAEAGLGRARVREAAAPGEIRDAWEWLMREGESVAPRGAELVRGLTEVLLLKLSDAHDAVGATPDAGARETFERCRALVDAGAARLRGAADLAAEAGLRTETVCRLFRRFLDTTPGAYLRARRVRLAAERLREPGARVKEVAAELGFADAFHFSRIFKAETGLAPRAWRARNGPPD